MGHGLWLYSISLAAQSCYGRNFKTISFSDMAFVLLNLLNNCDGCGKKFSVPHALSGPKGIFFMARNNDDVKEWGALSARVLKPSAFPYEPKINSRKVQSERNGAEVQGATGSQEGEVN